MYILMHIIIYIRPVWLNGSVLVYELSGCRFESHCSVYYETIEKSEKKVP